MQCRIQNLRLGGEEVGRSSRPLDKGGGGKVSKKIFAALWASVWSKNKGGAPLPWPPLPCESTRKEDSFEWSHHGILSTDSNVKTAN